MSFRDSLRRFIARQAAKIVRSYYEGGKRTTNRDFNNSVNAPFEATAAMDRDTMRARARWLHENNGIMANIDAAIVNNTVGNGLKLQIKSEDKNLNRRIEKLWERWCEKEFCDMTRRLHFGDMQRVILAQRMMDGEIIVAKRYPKDRKNPFRLQLVEADRIDSTLQNYNDADGIYADGIILDKDGAPKRYVIRQENFKSKEIPAANIIHYFKITNRATQYRGISEYRQSIIDLRNFAGYQSAFIKAARARANVAYFIETADLEARLAAKDAGLDGDPIEDINDIIVEYLSPGEKPHLLAANMNGDDHERFVKSAVRLIAVSRQVSYELAFRDYSQVNFSSARASIIQDHKRFSHEQVHLVTYVLRPIFNEWLMRNVYAGNIEGLSAVSLENNRDDFAPVWIPPKREWVDPLKDIKAIEAELNLGITTLKQVAGSRGEDLEDLIAQRKEEIRMLKEAGIQADDV
ncbi:phage portal protein [Hydrogenimonas urashimensis]|uniref:phage portal protein n=1 Tax=Hydrogenimonas urashimensis TaxID=2740515 RepID=UPI00191613AC|nr:phage portal protein [Hydrogenimonas urashimensis]